MAEGPRRVTEVVPFRLIRMPCCGFNFCNVNHRFPTYCPECGKHVLREVRGCVVVKDERAVLKFRGELP